MGLVEKKARLPVSGQYLKDAVLAETGRDANIREWGDNKTSISVEMKESGVALTLSRDDNDNGIAVFTIRSKSKTDPDGANAKAMRAVVDGIIRDVQARIWTRVRILDDNVTVDDDGPARCLMVQLLDGGLKFTVFVDLLDDFKEHPGKYAKGKTLEVFLSGQLTKIAASGDGKSGEDAPGGVPAFKCKVVDVSPMLEGQSLLLDHRGRFIIVHEKDRTHRVGDIVSVCGLMFWAIR